MKLQDVMTISEIEETYGIKGVTVKKAIAWNRFKQDEVRKSGNIWLLNRKAVEKLWDYKINPMEPEVAAQS